LSFTKWKLGLLCAGKIVILIFPSQKWQVPGAQMVAYTIQGNPKADFLE
jgi:hypothetical protein